MIEDYAWMAAHSSKPGRIGLTQIHGEVGKGIRFGQWLNGSGFEDYEHAFMDLGDGTLIEAEPGGAQINPLDKYTADEVYWCDNIYATIDPKVAASIAAYARGMKGVPYSFLDYDALFCHRLHIPVPGLREYISDTGHLICSQLCDVAYQRAGLQLFKDGRWNGYVTPGDLYQLDKRSAYVDLFG